MCLICKNCKEKDYLPCGGRIPVAESIHSNCPNIKEIPIIPGLKRLFLRECSPLKIFIGVELRQLSFSNCLLGDISIPLCNLEELNFHNCTLGSIHAPSGCRLQNLTFNNCSFTEYPIITTKTLTLYNMDFLPEFEFPVIPGLKNLVLQEVGIQNIPLIPGLRSLHLERVKLLKNTVSPDYLPDEELKIPVIHGLRKLVLRHSFNLKKIPMIHSLKELDIHYCPRIKKIPLIRGLRTIECCGCDVKKIPPFRFLESLTCTDCDFIVKIPKATKSYIKCHWLDKNVIRQLIICQKITKRKLSARRLERIKDSIVEIYFSPGCKGEWLAKKAFHKKLVM